MYIKTFTLNVFKTFPLLCYITTNVRKQGPSLKSDNLRIPYVIPCLLSNHKVRDSVYNNPPLVIITSQLYSLHNCPSNTIYFLFPINNKREPS